MYEPIGANGLTRLQHDTKFKIQKLRRDIASDTAFYENNKDRYPKTMSSVPERIERMQAKLTALLNNPTGQELIALGVV